MIIGKSFSMPSWLLCMFIFSSDKEKQNEGTFVVVLEYLSLRKLLLYVSYLQELELWYAVTLLYLVCNPLVYMCIPIPIQKHFCSSEMQKGYIFFTSGNMQQLVMVKAAGQLISNAIRIFNQSYE